MTEASPDLAILLFDLAPSGVATNAVRVAKAARDAGLITEIWLNQREGALLEQVPPDIPIRSLGQAIGSVYSRKDRKRAVLNATDLLADLLKEVRPKVLLSAGNHTHALAANITGGHCQVGNTHHHGRTLTMLGNA